MAKARKTDSFLAGLMDGLRPRLPNGNWISAGFPQWRFISRTSWGYVGVGPSMSYKYLPTTNVHLTYGLKHEILDSTLRRLTEAAGFEHHDWYQVSQDTQNYSLVTGRRSIVVEDYNTADSAAIMLDLLPDNAVANLVAWFERFSDLRQIRRSLEEHDKAMSSLGAPDLMVAIDLALDEVQHLRHYKDVCLPRYFSERIDEALAVLGVEL
jgi:hypothetical protein